MRCLVCSTKEATKDPQLGILACQDCRNRQAKFTKPGSLIEFTSADIKEGRRKYFKSTLQKYRNGELSKEFIDAYPERAQAMIKEKIHTEKEIKQARPVWSDISPAGGIDRTK